jgi:uncharacterized protein YgiM (DUF1202 family)
MRKDNCLTGKKCRAISDYRSAYPDPLKLKSGEVVTIEEKESEWKGWLWCKDENGKVGWIPENYIKRKGDMGKLLVNYDATELNVEKGEELEIIKEESVWLWCKNQNGNFGWIPKEKMNIR